MATTAARTPPRARRDARRDGVTSARRNGGRRATVEHLSPAERAARGKALRAETPRRSHGEWEPASDRPDPIAMLEEQAATRVPELVPIRYGRMVATPFTFYRGAAYVMAADLAETP